MLTKTTLAFGSLALGIAVAASSHGMTISNPTWVEGHELKPGDYRVEIEDHNARIKGPDTSIEVPATVHTATEKYPTTSFRTEAVNGKQQLEEIQFGGTKTSIVFKAGS